MRIAAKGLWSMVAMSISAWLVSAPLTAYFFGNFTPMGIVANLIVSPLSELVITAGCLSLVTGGNDLLPVLRRALAGGRNGGRVTGAHLPSVLRGRSGRQGDPGSSRFYLSLEDDLMRLFGSERIAKITKQLRG